MGIDYRFSKQWMWYSASGSLVDEDWTRFCQGLDGYLGSCQEPAVGLLRLNRGAQPPDPVQRERIGAVISSHPETRLRYVAVIVDSLLERGAMMAVLWIAKPSFKTRTFSRATDELWSSLDEVAGAEVVAELRRDFESALNHRAA